MIDLEANGDARTSCGDDFAGKLVVHHFGPDPDTVGGMATVLRLATRHGVGGDRLDSHATWRPGSRLATIPLIAASALALMRARPGEIAHIHLSEGGSFVREGLLVALAQMRCLVTVVTIHGASFVPFAHRHPALVSAVLRRADLVTCLEQGALDCVTSSAPFTRVEIVPNAVLVKESPSFADTDELVVFAGEIGLRKGADVMYQAWQIVARSRPNARCLMVGPITDFDPPGAERLEVRDPVDAVEMQRILRCARVVALPARAEGMPMILAEAMSLGRPFVSTAVGGIPELAEGGLLVPVEDELSLADRITELLANPDLAREIGERGRQFCAQTRSIEVIDARLRKLYSAAAAEK